MIIFRTTISGILYYPIILRLKHYKQAKKEYLKTFILISQTWIFLFGQEGFPLDKLLDNSSIIYDDVSEAVNDESIGLWQCMVDGDPDIDAIHRLIYQETPKFIVKSPLLYPFNNFCAFNSQNTLWRRKILFPLLYLPSTVSFRFTDILRGYVAQTIMHAKILNGAFFNLPQYKKMSMI